MDYVYDSGETGKACVQYVFSMYRALDAELAADMNIIADPDNKSGYATTYTFRGNFGP
jgi:hypothetical protein